MEIISKGNLIGKRFVLNAGGLRKMLCCKQRVNDEVWENFYEALEDIKSKRKNVVNNKDAPLTRWMQKVVEKVRISELAGEKGISFCPMCETYKVNFNDSRGWFACQNSSCKFKGNIVDFVDFIEDKWERKK